jgi:hypothetical protein
MTEAKVKHVRPDVLVPSGGYLYCHVYENALTGTARDLYWSVTVDFERFNLGNEECACSITCEWLRWPIHSWLSLDGCAADFQYGEQGFESSFYLFTHHPANHTRLQLTYDSRNIFTAEIAMEVPMSVNLGIDVEDPLEINAIAKVPFIGLVMIPGNVGPKTLTKTQLQQIAMDFVDLREYHSPEPENSGLKFRPNY